MSKKKSLFFVLSQETTYSWITQDKDGAVRLWSLKPEIDDNDWWDNDFEDEASFCNYGLDPDSIDWGDRAHWKQRCVSRKEIMTNGQ